MSSKQAKEQLLRWCSDQVAPYDLKIKNLSSSWKSGLAFCAILHHNDSSCIDYHSLSATEPERNLDLAFKVAHKRFGIYPLLDVEDLTCDRPDWKSIFTYVCEIRRALQGNVQNTNDNPAPKSKKKKKKEIPPEKQTQAELTKALSQAMEKARKQGKTGELIRANMEGRKMEFLFPYLEKKGWTLAVLQNMGINVDSAKGKGVSKAKNTPKVKLAKQSIQEESKTTNIISSRSPPPDKPLPIQSSKLKSKFLPSSHSTVSSSTFAPNVLAGARLQPSSIPAPDQKIFVSSKSYISFPDSKPVAADDGMPGQVQFGGSWYAATIEECVSHPGYFRATIISSNPAILQNLVNLTITVPEERVYVETQLKKALTRVGSSFLEATEDLSEKTKSFVSSVSGYLQVQLFE